MPEADVAAVRDAFSTWERLPGDPAAGEAAAARHFHADVEYQEDPSWPGASTYRGLEAVNRCFREYRDHLRVAGVRVESVVDAGREVVAVVRVAIRPGEGDSAVEHRWGYVCRVRDGKVASFRAHIDPAAAFEAAGVEQPAS